MNGENKSKINSIYLLIFFSAVIIFSYMSLVSAVTFTVTDKDTFLNTSTQDGGSGSETVDIWNPIQSAIDSAQSGDIIRVNPGDYNVTINITKDNLTLQASVDAGRVNLTTLNSTSDDGGNFIIGVGVHPGAVHGVNGSNTVIDGFTINVRNNSEGVLVFANNVTIKNNIFNYIGNNFTAANGYVDMNGSLININSIYRNISSGWIINNTFKNGSGSTSYNIRIIASNNNVSNILIENNSIQGGNQTANGGRASGVFLDGRGNGIMLYSILIKHNKFNMTADAIIISNATAVNISHNFIINTSLTGISLRGFKNGTTSAADNFDEFFITWNNFTNNGGPSIYLCNISGERTGNGNITTVRNKIISYNSFQGTDSAGAVNNSCVDADIVILNLTHNYWNSRNGPGNVTYDTIQRSDGRNISGGNLTRSNYAPWYDDASRTILHSITNGTAGQFFSTLKEAFDTITHNGTITLGNGTYEVYLNLTTLRNVTIRGANPQVTTIQGNRTFILAVGNDTLVEGVNIVGNGSGYGIVADHDNFVIKNNHFSDLRFAIHVHAGASHIGTSGLNITVGNIVNNTFWNATGSSGQRDAAILLNTSTQNIRSVTIANNSIYNATIAIQLISGSQGQGGIVSEIVIASNHLRNITDYGIVMYNVSAVNISYNKIGNVSKNSILVKGFRNSSLNEFFIKYNNFTDLYAAALYPIVQICNVSESTGGGFANLTDISKKIISYNIFVGSGVAVNNSCTDLNRSLNLTFNFWNNRNGPGNVTYATIGFSDGINITSGGAANDNATTYAPWYEDINLTILHSITNGTPGQYFSTFQAAVDSITHNGTITLGNGTYEAYANLTNVRNVTIRGANPQVTTIQGNRTFILAVGNDTLIEGVNIVGNGSGYGIVADHNNFVIRNNYFSDLRFAIHVHAGASHIGTSGLNITVGNIANNTFWNGTGSSGQRDAAILLNTSVQNIRSVTIANNSIYNTTIAISLVSGSQGQGGIVSEIVIASNNIRNITDYGIVMYNVSAVNISYNKIGNISKDGILIKGFRNSSLNEFFIKQNNFSDSYPGELYSMIKVCNVSAGTSAANGQFANLTDISKKIISYNSFVGAGVAVNNSCTDLNLSLNLTFNFWNSANGPGNITGNSISTGPNITLGGAANDNATTYTPWALNLNRTRYLIGDTLAVISGGMSITNNNTVIFINSSGTVGAIINITRSGAANATLSFGSFLNDSADRVMTNGSMNITVNTTTGLAQIRLPPSFNISSVGSWDGNIYLATVHATASVTPTDESANTEAVSEVYEVGSSTVNLTFDRAVRINISGEGANYVGYSTGANQFVEITAGCAADTQATGDALSAGGDCKITKDSDLIVWTKHFTKFATYSKTAVATAAATTSSAGTSAAGALAVTAWTKTYVVADEQFTSGYTQQFSSKHRAKVKVGTENHYVGVIELKEDKVTLEISSDPVKVELDIGEDAKVDVTNDGFYDIYVKLNGITSGKADLLIQKIHEEVPAEVAKEGISVETTGEVVGEEVPTEEVTEAERNLTWLWVLIGVILLVVIVILIGKKRRR